MNKNKLITALRLTAKSILSGSFAYSWGDNARCNCGSLACALLNISPSKLHDLTKEIALPPHEASKTHQAGSWTNMTSYHCPITGFSEHKIFNAFKDAGLTRDDMHDLEYLLNQTVIARMPKRTFIKQGIFSSTTYKSDVDYTNGEDVANYMLTWADILSEENSHDSFPLHPAVLPHKPAAVCGQTIVEYALILAFISVVAISVLIALGSTVSSTQKIDPNAKHEWTVRAEDTSWVCDRPPIHDVDSDTTTIFPSGEQPVIVHGGNYTVQQTQ